MCEKRAGRPSANHKKTTKDRSIPPAFGRPMHVSKRTEPKKGDAPGQKKLQGKKGHRAANPKRGIRLSQRKAPTQGKNLEVPRSPGLTPGPSTEEKKLKLNSGRWVKEVLGQTKDVESIDKDLI